MKTLLAIFKNQEAAELFNYIVSYTRLIAKNHPQIEESDNITFEIIPQEHKLTVQ